MQSPTKLLAIEMSIFSGINKENMILGKEEFDNYLKALYLAGYIQFKNDFVIEQARKRYRNGYRLRWFGYSSGETTF